MTDDTKPRPLKVFTCFDPTGRNPFCWGLVEDADEPRREHRAWHRHEEKIKQGMRDAITQRDTTIGDLRQEVADLRGDVKGIEIPEPTLGIEINRDGYADDELDDSPYADDDLAFPQSRADAAAAFAPDDDEDDASPVNPTSLYTPGPHA